MTGNSVRGRVNAAVFRGLDGIMHGLCGPRKQVLFADLPAAIVEIGAGTGANFRYYPRGTRVVAIEPNPYMHRPLRAAAVRNGVELEIRPEGAERIGLPDASVDAVVSTLVLCTVPDPRQAVAEVRRVLRPGGRFLFLEHVRAPAGSGLARVQRVAARPWAWFFEGCDVCRDTGRTLADAGFATIKVDRYRLRSAFVPANEQIVGVAVR
jgi:SAM-dependent methyltransferase